MVAVLLCWPSVLIPCGFDSTIILGPWTTCPMLWHYFGKWVSRTGIEPASPKDECRGRLCEALGAQQRAQLTSGPWGQQQGGMLQPFPSPPIGNQQDSGHAVGCGAAHVPAPTAALDRDSLRGALSSTWQLLAKQTWLWPWRPPLPTPTALGSKASPAAHKATIVAPALRLSFKQRAAVACRRCCDADASFGAVCC